MDTYSVTINRPVLSLQYTASPVLDGNSGWLGRYPKLFDYPTVLLIFRALALILPDLNEADRMLLSGGQPGLEGNGHTWTISIAERHGYSKVPVVVMLFDGVEQTYEATAIGSNDKVEHTQNWIKQGFDWMMARGSGYFVRPITWKSIIGTEVTSSPEEPGEEVINEDPEAGTPPINWV